MKKRMRTIGIVVFLQCISISLHAQTYFRGEQTVIQPLQVMIENYTAISFGKEAAIAAGENQFDKFNLYTYLQLIYDDAGKNYQIIFQTDFSGKILFLAYSNNLSAVFNNREKPLNVFSNCIKSINDHVSAVQHAAAAVKCIIDRLNYCSN